MRMAVFKKSMRKYIFLHPMDKKKLYFAVKSTLLQDKKKYSDKLKGALLDVDNMKVIGDHHLIVDGYLSMEVIADFHVFSPRPGQTLEGIINKQSRSHLGCLVLDTFNATLDKPSYTEFGDPQVGDLCTFVVTQVVVDGEILFLKGTLTRSYPSVTSDQETADVVLENNKTANENESSADNDNWHNNNKRSENQLHDSKTSHNKKKMKNSPQKKELYNVD